MSEFMIIDKVLNMSQTRHSARSLKKNLLRDGRIQNHVKDWAFWGKKHFHKTLYLKSLRGFCMCWVLNMSGSWIFQDRNYARVLNFHRYKEFTYFRWYKRVLNRCGDEVMEGLWIVSGFWICQVSAYASSITQGFEYSRIWLNKMPEWNVLTMARFWIGLV